MDIDEASQTVACANQIDATEPQTGYTSPYQRTMLISFTGAQLNGATAANPTALFNQSIEAIGGVRTTWGVTISAQ